MIQKAIEQYLAYQENAGRLVYQKNNSGAFKVQRRGGADSFVRFGKKGSPDFLIWLPLLRDGKVTCLSIDCPERTGGTCRGSDVRTLFVEVKNEKGRQADSQKEFQRRIEWIGGRYFIVRSLDEVRALVETKQL